MRTLIIAVGNEGMDVCDAHLLEAVHEGEDQYSLREAIKGAFADWAKTSDGQDYINDNGTNWGDAMSIPDEFLRAHGVSSMDALEDYSEGVYVNGGKFDNKIVVDHDEELSSYETPGKDENPPGDIEDLDEDDFENEEGGEDA